jgi:serine/threonine protein kinase
MSDGALQKLTDYVTRRLQKQNDPGDIVTRILIVALAVSSAFGGTANRYLQRDCKERMKLLSNRYDGVPLGKLMGGGAVGQKMHGAGISRHRALAMKVICDDLHVCKLSLQRAVEGGRDNRDYNVVDLDGRKYVVDLMVEPGALYPWKEFKAVAYIDGIHEVKQEPDSQEKNAFRGAMFMGEGGSDEIRQYLETESSELSIARPCWHIEGNHVKRLSLEPVASGGFGSVYKADHLGKTVAEKRLALKGRSIDSHHILDFVVEVALMRNLCHPNVLECIGGCVALDMRPRTMMLLTPWMPNGSLREAIQYEKVKKAHHFPLSYGMARGLGYIHSRGIVHCDFKSPNVLLDQDMAPRIGDFGLARLQDLMEQRIDSGACNGTPVWEAPEQIKRRVAKCDFGHTPPSWKHVEVTHKADVYAFGLVVWEIHNMVLPALEPCQKLKGELPELPDGAPWTSLVSSCCSGLPENRPDMEKVIHDLSQSERANLINEVAASREQMKQERQKCEEASKKVQSPLHPGPLEQLIRALVVDSPRVAHMDATPPKTIRKVKVKVENDTFVSDKQQLGIDRPGDSPGHKNSTARRKRCRSPTPLGKRCKSPVRQCVEGRTPRRKKCKVEAPAAEVAPEIIKAMETVNSNDTRPQGTKACPEECGFGRDRICSIRKSATQASYIMLIKGSDQATRQQLCQLTDKQCRGHSMPWINFILRETVNRKLSREQVYSLRQAIAKKFEVDGQ